jgi:hypothetical protein
MSKISNFIKLNLLGIAIAFGVCAFLYEGLISASVNFRITKYIGLIIFLIATYPKYRDNILMLRQVRGKIPEKGDLANIKFLKKWGETRNNGIIKYCILDGGLIFGFALCFIFSLLVMMNSNKIFENISSDPSNMLAFIGYDYLAGLTAGIITYRIFWFYNERKFNLLTDHLN